MPSFISFRTPTKLTVACTVQKSDKSLLPNTAKVRLVGPKYCATRIIAQYYWPSRGNTERMHKYWIVCGQYCAVFTDTDWLTSGKYVSNTKISIWWWRNPYEFQVFKILSSGQIAQRNGETLSDCFSHVSISLAIKVASILIIPSNGKRSNRTKKNTYLFGSLNINPLAPEFSLKF